MSRTTRLVAFLASFVAIAGVGAIWAGASAITGTQCAWIAILAALDAALLLRLATWPSGSSRAAMAFGITLLTIVCANAFVAAAQIGRIMGLRPYESLPRMSLELTTMHVQTHNGWPELLWYAAALVLAWRLGR